MLPRRAGVCLPRCDAHGLDPTSPEQRPLQYSIIFYHILEYIMYSIVYYNILKYSEIYHNTSLSCIVGAASNLEDGTGRLLSTLVDTS